MLVKEPGEVSSILFYDALYDQKGNKRCLAVLLPDAKEEHVPQILSGYTRFHLRSFELTDPLSDYARLYRFLTGQPSSRSSGLQQLNKLEPLPEKSRRTDFIKLTKEILIERATKEHPWVNSLGMKFVPVAGTQVLFSVWDTRVQDFEAFVADTNYDATGGMWSLGKDGWKQRGGLEGAGF